MARTPTLFKGQVTDPTAERRFKALERYVEDLERRLRKAEGARHLPRTAVVALSADQTTSLTAGNVVAFGKVAGVLKDLGLVKLSSGTITLKRGHRYRIWAFLEATFSASNNGSFVIQWRDDGSALTADDGVAPKRIVLLSSTVANASSESPCGGFELTPTTADAVLTLEITTSNNPTAIEIGSRVLIEEVAK